MKVPIVFNLGNIITASQKPKRSTMWQVTFHVNWCPRVFQFLKQGRKYENLPFVVAAKKLKNKGRHTDYRKESTKRQQRPNSKHIGDTDFFN